jgi:hypothetical protein
VEGPSAPAHYRSSAEWNIPRAEIAWGQTIMRFSKLAHALCCALVVAAPAYAARPDHTEFDATLAAPFLGAHGDAREFGLQFSFPEADDPSVVAWKLEVVSPEG